MSCSSKTNSISPATDGFLARQTKNMISRDCAKCSSHPKTFVVTFGLACKCSVQKDHCTCTSCASETNCDFCDTENTVKTTTGVVHTTYQYYLLIMQYFSGFRSIIVE